MMPRTNHHDFKVQMQIHEQKGFPKILYGLNQDLDQRSITLKPGHEYKIELYPYGQVTTKDFKELSQDRRGCRLRHETLPNATHPIYARDNCIFDCHKLQAIVGSDALHISPPTPVIEYSCVLHSISKFVFDEKF